MADAMQNHRRLSILGQITVVWLTDILQSRGKNPKTIWDKPITCIKVYRNNSCVLPISMDYILL